MISRKTVDNQRLLTAGLVAFAMACCLLLLPGCVEEDQAAQAESETVATEATEEQTTEPTTEQSTEQATDTEEEIPSTESYSDEDVWYDWEVPPNAEDALYPSQEEIEQAMRQEAQEAMQHMYYEDEQYYDYDSSLGKRGR